MDKGVYGAKFLLGKFPPAVEHLADNT